MLFMLGTCENPKIRCDKKWPTNLVHFFGLLTSGHNFLCTTLFREADETLGDTDEANRKRPFAAGIYPEMKKKQANGKTGKVWQLNTIKTKKGASLLLKWKSVSDLFQDFFFLGSSHVFGFALIGGCLENRSMKNLHLSRQRFLNFALCIAET